MVVSKTAEDGKTNGHSPACDGDESERKLMENVKMANGGDEGKVPPVAMAMTAVAKARSKRFVNKKGFARRGIFMRNGTACWSKSAGEDETKGENQFPFFRYDYAR